MPLPVVEVEMDGEATLVVGVEMEDEATSVVALELEEPATYVGSVEREILRPIERDFESQGNCYV